MNKELREHEREKRIRKFKEGEEQNRKQRSAVRENFMQFQRDKEEKAQRYKQERLDAMKEKRMFRDYNDTYRERASAEAKEKKVVRIFKHVFCFTFVHVDCLSLSLKYTG